MPHPCATILFVSLSRILFFAACLAFLAANISGAHVHREMGEHGHSTTHAQELHHSHEEVVLALSSAHIDDHLLHGDVDVEAKITLAAKAPTLLVLLSVIFALALINFLPYRRGPPPRIAERYPGSLLREHLLPPSQAPPVTT